jgi:hypothetical protein
MKRLVIFYSIVFSVFLFIFLAFRVPAHAIGLTIGPLTMDFGGMGLSASSLRFPDGTVMTSAATTGAQGPAGPAGPAGPVGPAGPAAITTVYSVQYGIDKFDQKWNNPVFDSNNLRQWVPFSPLYDLVVDVPSAQTNLRVTWTDNVGIYDASWCNVGVFFDDQRTPVCWGSWSGVLGTSIFNTQTVSCITHLSPGSHTFSVKHRSEYCMYGNYPFDIVGSPRSLTVEVYN